jgi:hypothetical protein
MEVEMKKRGPKETADRAYYWGEGGEKEDWLYSNPAKEMDAELDGNWNLENRRRMTRIIGQINTR